MQKKILFKGDDYYETMLSLIDQAKREILLEVYIFNFDSIGKKIVHALNEASSRNIKVSVVVDGFGSYYNIPDLKRAFAYDKVNFAVFHPVRILPYFSQINKRNHRKTLIVDGETALVGSFNITHEHSEILSQKKSWRDTAVLVKGPEVEELRSVYLQMQRKVLHRKALLPHPHQIKLLPRPQSPFLFNHKMSLRRHYESLLKKQIREAKHRIFITNPYFVPKQTLIMALRHAAKKNRADVELCLPQASDVPLVRWASLTFYGSLLKDGVKIWDFENRFLHAKTCIIDDWATVGSSNLNYRSLVHDLEVSVIVTDEENLKILRELWQSDIQNSHAFSLKEWNEIGFYDKMKMRFAILFKYWL